MRVEKLWRGATLGLGMGVGCTLAAAHGCSASPEVDPGTSYSSTSGDGGSGRSTTSSGQAGQGGDGGSGGSGAGATGGSGGAGGSGGVGAGGTGGGWPTCDSQPSGVDARTIHQVWQADPTQPTELWVSGVVVTAVSRGGCQAGQACQIFLQQNPTYGSFAAGAHHAIKLFASAATALHFDTIAVGDVVDVLAHAWRYNIDGQNELLLQVNAQLPGCAKAVGTASPSPITGVTLPDLTVQSYEQTHGPLLIRVANVSGTPGQPQETFALWETGVFSDAGIESVTSLSPYFLSGVVFSGLTQGLTTDFDSVTGVFGLFVPPNGPKYEMIYPRTLSEIVVK